MILLEKYQNLKLPFRKNGLQELSSLQQRLSNAKAKLQNELEVKEEDTLKELKSTNEEISTGSRVFIKFDNGLTRTGRVWGKKAGTDIYAVNKDGNVNYQNISRSKLKNLSTGKYLETQREIWLLEQEINQLEDIVKEAELPVILNADGSYLIEAIAIESRFAYDLVLFVSAN